MTGFNKTGVSFDQPREPAGDAYYDEKDASSIKQDNYSVDVAPARRGTLHDDVWGDIDGDGPNYRGLGW